MVTTIEEAAREAAGNWKEFESFGWHDKPDDAENWTIVYTSNRDSRLIEQSNAAAIEKAMEPFFDSDDPDIQSESHNHWAVGYVDGYAIRVYRDGQITEAFKAYVELMERLEDYPLLDEEDYSRREYEATIENIKSEGCPIDANLPEDWAGQVYSWLSDNNFRAVENRDDQGGYADRWEIAEAVAELGFVDDPEFVWAVATANGFRAEFNVVELIGEMSDEDLEDLYSYEDWDQLVDLAYKAHYTADACMTFNELVLLVEHAREANLVVECDVDIDMLTQWINANRPSLHKLVN